MQIRPQYLDRLHRAWNERDLVIFLGAGVSIPHGIPNWNNLVMELLLEEDSRFAQFWPNYQMALVEWLSKTYDFSPLALSRVFKYRVAEKRADWTPQDQASYLKSVRAALYRKRAPANPDNDSLWWVKDFILKGQAAGKGVKRIVTANFDDLLEQHLAPHQPVVPIYNESRPAGAGMQVLHVHGYLPQHGDEIPPQDIVFAEDEYNALTYTMFHWAQVELVNLMRTSTLLFIGFSLTDQNIRRLLDATRPRDGSIQHFAVKRDYVIDPAEKDYAVNDINYRAARNNQSQLKETPLEMHEAIHVALERARRYDDEMLARMGVGVLWMKEFTDIREILDQISA